jgi:HSP90 family molecular chaperone
MGREDPGVHLYSRKILIQSKNKHILPEWLRFVKGSMPRFGGSYCISDHRSLCTGVVDSEDIPLNISRESMQDSALIRRINTVLTKRLLRFFKEQSKNEPEKYFEFFGEFGNFLKEGICTDNTNKVLSLGPSNAVRLALTLL